MKNNLTNKKESHKEKKKENLFSGHKQKLIPTKTRKHASHEKKKQTKETVILLYKKNKKTIQNKN